MDTKKAAILKAADTLFSKKGYAATSINDILTATNTSKGNLYHHFESKQALLLGALRYKSSIWTEEWENAYKPSASAAENIHAYVKISVTYLIDPLLTAVYDATRMDGFSPKELKMVDDILTEQQKPLIDVIKQGTATGELKKNKPELIADVILAMICGLDDIYDYSKRPGTLRKQAREAVDILISGIGVST